MALQFVCQSLGDECCSRSLIKDGVDLDKVIERISKRDVQCNHSEACRGFLKESRQDWISMINFIDFAALRLSADQFFGGEQ